MTDGYSNRDEHLTTYEADLAKSQNIEIFGIGRWTHLNLLNTVLMLIHLYCFESCTVKSFKFERYLLLREK